MRRRRLAWGGVVGPIAFVLAWVIAGATSDLSPIDDAISDLAAVGASTRVVMTIGFLTFGLGLIGFGVALRAAWPGPAWIAAVVTGTATIGVAATPLGGWSGDGVHAAFAGVGYVSIVALPALASRPLARADRSRAAHLSVLIAVIAGACLVASTLGPAHGLWQRLGLLVGDAWIVAAAVALVRVRPVRRPAA